MRGTQAGFTLIEVLVVAVILGVLASVVTLTLAGGGGERQLEREAQRLRALVAYACERAELTGRPIGLSFVRGGYLFSEHAHSEWRPLTDGELRPREWNHAIGAQLSRDGVAVAIGAEAPKEPQLACFTSGELTPFRLEIGLVERGIGWRLAGEPDGSLKLERHDAR